MAKIERYQGNLEAFASDALAGERTIFGSTASGDTLTENINASYKRGWGVVGVNENPTKQDFNALNYVNSQLAAYLHQVGVAEWDNEQEYHTGSICNISGILYRSLTDTNIGNNPVGAPFKWQDLSTAAGVTFDDSGVDFTAADVQAAIEKAAASGGFKWVIKSLAYTAVNGDGVLVDTSGGTIIITLPITPSAGDKVAIVDFTGSFGTNNCTIERNGSSILGLASNLVLNSTNAGITLVYSDAAEGWVLWTDKEGAKGAGGDHVFFENDQTVNNDYNITSGKNAMSAGPIEIDTGATVTVPSGSVWTIV